MHPADIKAALKKSGSSMTDIATRLDVSVPAVLLVIESKSTSKKIAKAIAKKTGFGLDQLWPGVYTKEAA